MKIRDRIRELRRVPASELRPNPKNWRTHPQAQADALKGVLAEVGIADAVLARELDDGSLMLLDGHLRVETMGDQVLPVLVLDVNEAEGDKVLATLDPLAAMAESDAAKLDAILRDVDTGSPELQQMLADLAEDAGLYKDESDKEIVEDEVPEPPVDPITKPGDLWTLGDHRLLCGDSTNESDLTRLSDGQTYSLVMIDPPYGINAAHMTMGSGQSSKPKSERLSNVSNWDGSRPPIKHLIGSQKCCVWGGNYFTEQLPVSDDWLCWHKKNDGLSFGEFELAWCNFGTRTRLLAHHWGKEKKEHITQKPVAVIAWAINQSGTEGIIADFFIGSGTTLIAAEQLGRKCYGMEISPQYCDVIVKRWETLTGKKAELDKPAKKTKSK